MLRRVATVNEELQVQTVKEKITSHTCSEVRLVKKLEEHRANFHDGFAGTAKFSAKVDGGAGATANCVFANARIKVEGGGGKISDHAVAF